MLSFPLQPVLLRALNSHLLARPAGRCLVCVPCAWGCRGARPPLGTPCGTGAGPTAQATAPWLPGLEFGCSRVLCSVEGLAKCTPTFSFRLLPPPASEVSGAGLVPVSSFHPRSSSPAAQSPPQGSQKQVARKIIGKKNEGNRKIHFF